jgi:hypothetical protein
MTAINELAEASLNALILVAHVIRQHWAAVAITAALWVTILTLFTLLVSL